MLKFLLVLTLLTAKDSSDNSEFLNEVNSIRVQGCYCGDVYYSPVNPIVWSDQLTEIATLHSKDMSEKKYFSHVSPSGNTPADRLKVKGYKYRSYAENIFSARGYVPTVKQVVLAWKNSPSHCKNLMNNTVKEMGVGVYNGYYTQLFGGR